MTNFEYLDILRRKTTEKTIAKEIKACKKKEKKDKWAKQIVELGSIITRAIRKTIKKHVRTQFTVTWIPTSIAKMEVCFHFNFQVSFQIDLCKYMVVNLGKVV